MRIPSVLGECIQNGVLDEKETTLGAYTVFYSVIFRNFKRNQKGEEYCKMCETAPSFELLHFNLQKLLMLHNNSFKQQYLYKKNRVS
jgi:hypothetical protein